VTAGSGSVGKKIKRCAACKREYPATEIICSVDNTLLMTVAEDPLIGMTLADKYLVISEIGRGGMSVVYKGKHTLMDRIIAIKMLQQQLVEDQMSTKRFQQEAQAVSHLSHPGIIGVHDYGIAPSGQPYLIMDYLVGESLADVIKQDHSLPEKRAIGLFMQACDALDHAHKKGVIHRDLKSSNIMLVESEGKTDLVKVVDFGIAKLTPASGKQQQNLTQTGEIFGSPIYMSPEQCMGQPLDVRSDVYSMGVLMYETLTGFPPLMGQTIVETMQMHVANKPQSFATVRPDLNISKEIEVAILKALEKNPDDRYVDMRACYDALDAVYQKMITGRTSNAIPLLEPEPTLMTPPRPTTSAYNLPRARYQNPNPNAISRYGMKSYDQVVEAKARGAETGKTMRAKEEVEDPKKGSVLPVIIIAGAVILLLCVVAFFSLHGH
jgi:serine/threonine-protein kinase